MRLIHVCFSTTRSVGYTIKVPDDANAWSVADDLLHSDRFIVRHVLPDLCKADRGDIAVDVDSWVEEVDFTYDDIRELTGGE